MHSYEKHKISLPLICYCLTNFMLNQIGKEPQFILLSQLQCQYQYQRKKIKPFNWCSCFRQTVDLKHWKIMISCKLIFSWNPDWELCNNESTFNFVSYHFTRLSSTAPASQVCLACPSTASWADRCHSAHNKLSEYIINIHLLSWLTSTCCIYSNSINHNKAHWLNVQSTQYNMSKTLHFHVRTCVCLVAPFMRAIRVSVSTEEAATHR